MKVNYSLILENTIANLTDRPRLLLHACCAPCSSYVLEYIAKHFDLTLFFFNPNISPQSEFTARLDELKRFNHAAGYDVPILVPDYDDTHFYESVRGLEDIPEGGSRCRICYELRLRGTAEAAKAHGFDYFTTTLSISPHKNAAWLNEIGLELEKEYGIPWLCSDFKKKNGYKRSIELSAEYGLYRQDYCGCEFSRKQRLSAQSNIKEERE